MSPTHSRGRDAHDPSKTEAIGGHPVKPRFVPVFVLILVLAFPCAPTASQGATPGPTAGTERNSTAILVASAGTPMRVPGTDGQDHIEYDLLVTNAFVAPVTLTSVEVLDESGEILLALEGDALAAVTQSIFAPQPVTSIPIDGSVAIVIDVIVPPERTVDRVTHRIVHEMAPDAPARAVLETFQVDGPVLDVSPQPAIVISPPMRGAGWLSANGCCLPTVHRSVRISDGTTITKAETFTIDWIRWQDGKVFRGDGTGNDDWYAYGADMLAVADGIVVSTRNDMPDETPFQAPEHLNEPGDFAGNHVIIEIEPGVYAFYAHLAPGSVTVSVGDSVETGDVVGKLGNSGSTSGPHLHFGLLDYPDPLVGNSLPLVFDAYTIQGTIDGELIERMDGGPTGGDIPLSGDPQPQTETHQLVYTVADFGE